MKKRKQKKGVAAIIMWIFAILIVLAVGYVVAVGVGRIIIHSCSESPVSENLPPIFTE